MTLATLPAWARDLIAAERVAYLALIDGDDRPRVLPITFACAGDLVWSAIDRKPKRASEPARVGWLRRRPEAALCIDRYDDDWDRLAWVQLLSQVEVLDASAGERGLQALAAKYDQYLEAPPPGPVLRMRIDRALSWRAADYPE